MEITFQFLFTIEYRWSVLPFGILWRFTNICFFVSFHVLSDSTFRWLLCKSANESQKHNKSARLWIAHSEHQHSQRVHYENWNKLLCIRWHSTLLSFHIWKSWQTRSKLLYTQDLFRDKFKLREHCDICFSFFYMRCDSAFNTDEMRT